MVGRLHVMIPDDGAVRRCRGHRIFRSRILDGRHRTSAVIPCHVPSATYPHHFFFLFFFHLPKRKKDHFARKGRRETPVSMDLSLKARDSHVGTSSVVSVFQHVTADVKSAHVLYILELTNFYPFHQF